MLTIISPDLVFVVKGTCARSVRYGRNQSVSCCTINVKLLLSNPPPQRVVQALYVYARFPLTFTTRPGLVAFSFWREALQLSRLKVNWPATEDKERKVRKVVESSFMLFQGCEIFERAV